MYEIIKYFSIGLVLTIVASLIGIGINVVFNTHTPIRQDELVQLSLSLFVFVVAPSMAAIALLQLANLLKNEEKDPSKS